MKENTLPRTNLTRLVISRYLMAFVALAAIFFLPAGTLAYWQAWFYLALIFLPMLFVMVYLMRNDPELLERRMRTREQAKEQSIIVKLAMIPFVVAFLIPGFDVRYGWSHVPAWVVIAAGMVVLASYAFVFLVFRENKYASRVVEVEPGQKVIASGPYALVRHPMYLGMLTFYVFSPLVLGSYWAVIPAAMIIPVLAARLLSEEKILARDLPGYTEYMRMTRYHLFPGVW